MAGEGSGNIDQRASNQWGSECAVNLYQPRVYIYVWGMWGGGGGGWWV